MRLRDHLTWESAVRYRFKIGAVAAFLAGLGIIIWLGVAASSETPPDGAQSGLLVVGAAALQGASVWAFGKDRPSLATTKTAVRHVAIIGRTVAEARQLAEEAVDDGREAVAALAVRELSVRLSFIQLQVTTNLEDWVEAHPEILPRNETENGT